MKTTKTMEWKSQTGKVISVEITVESKVVNDTAYADGWNVDLGKKTYQGIDIEISFDGKVIDNTMYQPQILNKNEAYAKIGSKVGITEEVYNQIMGLIAEAMSESESEEYLAVKAIENAKEAAKEAREEAAAKRYDRQIKNGLCPKCGSYCYGDCRA